MKIHKQTFTDLVLRQIWNVVWFLFCRFTPVPFHIWRIFILKLFGAKIKFNVNIDLFFWLLKNKNNYDVFILHGLWDFKNILARIILKTNYYIFVHGALDPYEKKTLFKYFKKKVYWFLFEKKNLLNAKKVLLTILSSTYFYSANKNKMILS